MARTIQLVLVHAASAALLSSAARSGPVDAAQAIESEYRSADLAFARSDAEGLVRSVGPSLRVTAQDGQTAVVTHAQALAAAAHAVRPLDSGRAVRSSTTRLESVRQVGDHYVAIGTTVEVIDGQSEFAVTHVQDTIGFEDEWRLENGRWLLAATRRTAFSRTGGGQPSAAATAALRNMRESNEMLRSFNAANNFSFCMNQAQVQKYDYETRKQGCSQ